MKCIHTFISYTVLILLIVVAVDSRPSNIDNSQYIDLYEQPDFDDIRSNSYDVPTIPMDRLQMLIAHYKPNAYLRSPSYNNIKDYYHPEVKRQVRYRQCYFNPISCFKK